MPTESQPSQDPRIDLVRGTAVLTIRLSGTWRVSQSLPPVALVRRELDEYRPERIELDARDVVAWDSALVSFADRVERLASAAGATVDRSGLPPGVQRLVALARATPARAAAPREPPPSTVARIGLWTIDHGRGVRRVVGWVGELSIAFAALVAGRARFRRSELHLQMQLAGANAFGIVSLVAGLVGLILAFIGGIQLQRFGATVYVADLVGIAIVREMGAMMAAIVVAGRTGAAFAAELGTMRVNQEIDAFTTLGISPVQFLVLPRVLAVTLMMPLLCIYADLMGVLGGAVIGIGVMHIEPRVYLDATLDAVSYADLFGGIFKATVYGFLVGAAGCFEGLGAGRTAAGVGKAATSAVVDGIVLVIAACAVFAIIFYRLGI
jgi:phospholipid/cholesterol/gamma-HCH transport system permease protein